MPIERITIDRSNNQLSIEFADKFQQNLSFEFLRVYSPAIKTAKKGQPNQPVSNQKMVNLVAIDTVAKHGFRLHFDDTHNAIYSAQILEEFAHNKARLWQEYLDALATTGHSREAMIEIKQVL